MGNYPHPADDRAVSPVIAVILMVAITVVLAATVYVWISGFNANQQAPESAQVRAVGFDQDGNGATEWLRLVLVSGENSPYADSVVNVTTLAPSGTESSTLCNTPELSSSTCTTPFTGSWVPGEALWVPCQDQGAHQITVVVRGSVILDQKARCDGAA